MSGTSGKCGSATVSTKRGLKTSALGLRGQALSKAEHIPATRSVVSCMEAKRLGCSSSSVSRQLLPPVMAW
eukprot:CAMPEP_0180522818 /NCGR_PEP_ID=MMETSP1036_2-20121128/57637_1 /TAXON_ID=632150 /ORGANISM="Azadinium spinosum, Strain 3D9" /LENGTH=70 /DNA_ID=CAMNT_0022535675 /DNA_START=59 /DNA_END=268 /DNA_ORIENTATION=-